MYWCGSTPGPIMVWTSTCGPPMTRAASPIMPVVATTRGLPELMLFADEQPAAAMSRSGMKQRMIVV